jgi:hypothetical protein
VDTFYPFISHKNQPASWLVEYVVYDINDLWCRQLLVYFLLIIHVNTLKGEYKDMRKAIFILVITLIVAVTVMPASASRYGRGPGAVHGYGKDITAIPDLNLTVEQKAQITSLRETFFKDIKPLRDKLFSKRGDLKLLWKDKNPNQAKNSGNTEADQDVEGSNPGPCDGSATGRSQGADIRTAG